MAAAVQCFTLTIFVRSRLSRRSTPCNVANSASNNGAAESKQYTRGATWRKYHPEHARSVHHLHGGHRTSRTGTLVANYWYEWALHGMRTYVVAFLPVACPSSTDDFSSTDTCAIKWSWIGHIAVIHLKNIMLERWNLWQRRKGLQRKCNRVSLHGANISLLLDSSLTPRFAVNKSKLARND